MKKTIVIPLLTATVILLGIFGGIAAAQSGSQDRISSRSSIFTSRVAEILGIEDARVEQAFKQAVSETRDSRMNNLLDRLVESGKITQEQADRKLEWMEDDRKLWNKHHPFRNPHNRYENRTDKRLPLNQ